MAGGAPIPVPVSRDPDEIILSIADLEKAASKKLGKSAKGEYQASLPNQYMFSDASFHRDFTLR